MASKSCQHGARGANEGAKGASKFLHRSLCLMSEMKLRSEKMRNEFCNPVGINVVLKLFRWCTARPPAKVWQPVGLENDASDQI